MLPSVSASSSRAKKQSVILLYAPRFCTAGSVLFTTLIKIKYHMYMFSYNSGAIPSVLVVCVLCVIKYTMQHIHILDTARITGSRSSEEYTVWVPEAFDLPVFTERLDRLGVRYAVQGLPGELFWWRGYAPARSENVYSINFSGSWSQTVPWLYHAGFSAGWDSAWPEDSPWPLPAVELSHGGRVVLTDVHSTCGSLWGQLASRDITVEPVDPRVRQQLREQGFGLLLSGDPPSDPVGKTEWLLAGEVPNNSAEINQDNTRLARDRIRAALKQYLGLRSPVWARDWQAFVLELRQQAVRWGFEV